MVENATLKLESAAEIARRRVADALIPDDPSIPLDEFQAAKLLGCSVYWLRRKRWSGGGIPYIQLADNGIVRYTRPAIDSFQASKIRKSTSDR